MRESPALLRVYLFGHFSVECNGHSVTGLEARRVQEVFSYLLLNRHRRCSREVLASLFWGESSTEQAKRNLRQVLWQLQAALEPEKAEGSECFLRVTADWLQANLNSDLWLDVDCFEKAWDETKQKAGKDLDATSAQLLCDAIALHQDALLLDNYEDWCLRARERLFSLCIAMLEKLMEYSETRHDYEAALRFGMRILDYDRVRETTHQQLMRLYYLLGKRVEALKQYQQCEAALLEELGALPSKGTRVLYQRIFLDQLGGESGRETLARDLEGEASLLAHILSDLQQVQSIQSYAQRQIDFRIQKIEQTLHTIVGAAGEISASEKRGIPTRDEKARKKTLLKTMN